MCFQERDYENVSGLWEVSAIRVWQSKFLLV